MLTDFLTDLERQISREIYDIHQKIDSQNSKLVEEQKFLGLIQDEHKEDFKDFSPRRFESGSDKRLHSTQDYINSIESNIEDLNSSLKIKTEQLKQIRQCIREASGMPLSRTNQMPSSHSTKINNASDITKKLDLISSLIQTDPFRAKIEVDELKKSIG